MKNVVYYPLLVELLKELIKCQLIVAFQSRVIINSERMVHSILTHKSSTLTCGGRISHIVSGAGV